MDAYTCLRRVEQWAAEWYATTRAAIAEPLMDAPNEDPHRALALALEVALAPLTGAIVEAYGSSVSPTDLFAAALTGKPGGLGELTPEEATNLLRVLGVRQNERGIRANHDTLAEVAAMVKALATSGYKIPDPNKETTMAENTTTPGIPVEPDVPAVTNGPSMAVMVPSEASLSATASVIDPNGIDWLVTVRRFEPVTGESFVDFVRQLSGAGKYLLDHGYAPRNRSVSSEGPRHSAPAPAPAPAPTATPAQVAAPAPVAAPASVGTPAPAAPAGNGNGNGNGNGGAETFAAIALVGEMKNGKTYWKVTGGRYSRHGLTVWPEVLGAAGFDTNTLNPATTYNLAGYVATWTTDENGYKKITALERA